jgi:hypothetical protein
MLLLIYRYRSIIGAALSFPAMRYNLQYTIKRN